MSYFWDMSVNVVADPKKSNNKRKPQILPHIFPLIFGFWGEYKNYKNEVVAQLTDNMTYITDSFYDSPNKFTDGECNGDAICAYY